MNININQDCPNCGQPGLIDTSTNFKHEWSCNFCETRFDPDNIRKV